MLSASSSRPLPAMHQMAECHLRTDVRSHVNTETAAFYLNRKEQTLRMWACYENGPVRPIRINKRLAWPVADIREILKLEAA